MRSFECFKVRRQELHLPSNENKAAEWCQFSSENDNPALLLFCFVLLRFAAAEEKCSVLLFPCLLPLSDFQHFCLSFLIISQKLLQHLEKVLPHGNTQGNGFSFPFHISLSQVQDVMGDSSCHNESEGSIDFIGVKSSPLGTYWKNGKEFPFSQRICHP